MNMSMLWEIVAALLVIAGTFFSVVGMLGTIRFPDVYARLHAAGKVGVFGVVLLLLAAVAVEPGGWGRGLALIFLLLLTGPVTAHAIASAAYRLGIPLRGAVRDDLKKKRVT